MDNQLTAKIEAIASQMGMSANDALAFIAGVQVWADKGMDIKSAINKHMEVMRDGCALMLGKAVKP